MQRSADSATIIADSGFFVVIGICNAPECIKTSFGTHEQIIAYVCICYHTLLFQSDTDMQKNTADIIMIFQ